MNWQELDDLLLSGTFKEEPAKRDLATNEFVEWFAGARGSSQASDLGELCEFVVGRVLYSRDHFADQFRDEPAWWSAAILFHTSAQAALTVENENSFVLADSAWHFLCRILGMKPEPELNSESTFRNYISDFSRKVSELGNAAMPARLFGSDVLRIRSHAYASSQGTELLRRAHSDLHFALALLDTSPKETAYYITNRRDDEDLDGLILVPSGPDSPPDMPGHAFLLSGTAEVGDPAEIVLAQKLSLLRELAFVEEKLAILVIRSGDEKSGRQYLQEASKRWQEIRAVAARLPVSFSAVTGSNLESLLSEFANQPLNHGTASPAMSNAAKQFFYHLDWSSSFRKEGVETLKGLLLFPDLTTPVLELVLKGKGMTPAILKQVLESLPASGIGGELELGKLIEAWADFEPQLRDEFLTVWVEFVHRRSEVMAVPRNEVEVTLCQVLLSILTIARANEAEFRESSVLRAILARTDWIRKNAHRCSRLVEEILGFAESSDE